MKQQEQRHGRWTNFETLAAAVCLEADLRSRAYWKNEADNCKTEAYSIRAFLADCWTVGSVARSMLADRLENELTADRITGTSLHADVLRRSLKHVKWLEIADHFLTNDSQKSNWTKTL
jgi:hypothetical protein